MFTPNKKQKIFWLTTLIGMAVFFTTLAGAQAQVSTQKEVDKLFEIKDSTQISPEEKERLEKESRVKIIFNVVDLSQIQLEELKEAWKNIPNFPEAEDWQKIRELFLREMEKSQEYWGETKDSFEEEKESLDIDGLKILAKKIEKEKTAQIDPVIERASDIIMTFDLTEMLKVVDQRLEKVKSDINKIYSKKLTQNPLLKNLLIQTSDYISQAHQYNDRSKQLILHLYGDQDTSSAEELLKELRRQFGKGGGDFSSEEENIKEEGHRYIRELTVLSFEKIKSAYELFVRMSLVAKQLVK